MAGLVEMQQFPAFGALEHAGRGDFTGTVEARLAGADEETRSARLTPPGTSSEGQPLPVMPQVDPVRFDRAPVVLRVRFAARKGGDKYLLDTVEILEVFKNDPAHPFGDTLDIAHYSWSDGIPEGECTVYLVPPGEESGRLWKLLGGGAKQGVSHVAPEA